MTDIRKYSKEWFVLHGSDDQKEVLQNLEQHYKNKELVYGIFNTSALTGTKEEVQQKLNDLQKNAALSNSLNNSDKFQNNYVEKAGGLDNLFGILDENKDGVVTEEEISTFSAIDSDEFVVQKKNTLSLQDLQVFYKNAQAAKGATHIEEGNTEKFIFKDGSLIKYEKDENGNTVSKYTETTYSNKDKASTLYNYQNQTRFDTVVDSRGRVKFSAVDAPGKIDDYKKQTIYNKDNSKVVTTNTVGRTITETISNNEEIISKTENLKYKSDAKIDNTKQSNVGDCWILAGMNALRTIDAGAEAIKGAIQHNPDNSITIKLKGVNKEYTYTPEQIAAHEYTNRNKHFSFGDIDMNLIEMAITDYRKEYIASNPEEAKKGKTAKASVSDPSNGGYLEEAIYYLTGKNSNIQTDKSKIKQFLNSKTKEENRYALTFEFSKKDETINNGSIVAQHAYSVSRVTEDTVYIVNTWDSSKEIAYPKEKFMDNCLRMAFFDFK